MKHLYQIILIVFALTVVGANQSYGQQVVKSETVTKSTESIKIFPNPADDKITLKVDKIQVGYITISDIVGKEIKRFDANPDHVYDVSFLSRGIYIVRVLDDKEELIKPLRLSKS